MAGVERARSVIVSVGRDDTTVLVVLTVRALAKDVRLIANVGEPENIKLVKSGGADVVVSPPRFGGVLMADAVESQSTVEFVSELISYRGSYQLVEREPRADEIGREAHGIPGVLVVEIRRGGRRIGLWNEKNLRVEAGRPPAGDRFGHGPEGEPRPDPIGPRPGLHARRQKKPRLRGVVVLLRGELCSSCRYFYFFSPVTGVPALTAPCACSCSCHPLSKLFPSGGLAYTSHNHRLGRANTSKWRANRYPTAGKSMS